MADTMLWELRKDGRETKCLIRPQAGQFEIAVVYEGLRMQGQLCPHKGDATYYSVCNGRTARNAVWSYEQPIEQVQAIKDHLAFYPDKVDAIDCS